MTEKPKAVRVGNITVTPITAKEHKILEEKIKKRHERPRIYRTADYLRRP